MDNVFGIYFFDLWTYLIGELEDLSNASLQDALDFHAKYYAPIV